MEAPELTCPVSPARIRPAPAPGPQGPRRAGLTAPDPGPVILPPPEQGLAPAMFLKALPVPLHHTVPPGGLQPRTPLVTGGLDGGGGAFLLSPLLQPEGPSPAAAGKPTLAVSIVGALPVLSPGLGPALGSPGRVRGAGRYLCPHCGRDCLKPSVLEKHVRSHTGERPFPCATCGVAFKTQSNLYKHRRTQTHLNNARLAAQSGGAGGLPEGVAKAGEPSGTDGQEDPGGQGLGDGAPRGTAPSPGALAAAHLSPAVAKSWEVKLDTAAGLGPPGADREALGPAVLPAGAQPRWKLPEQKSPTAVKPCPSQPPQPQAASAEKSWEAKAPEGQLRKCESTDSGYLSRSDSAEQPLAPCSPLHGPWEHGGPAEGEGTPGPGERGASLGLEKKQLEERIARLISHNQAVVDDPQLDHVRPRKSGLSKQGSIDLPAPHTYRGSFHFDIRAREPGCRRPAPLCPARSTLAPLDRSRPLFFHSVPTQLSTTVECVPVTRSNSLPFLDGTRTWQELQDPQGGCPLRQRPLSPRPAPGPRGASSGLAWVGVPSGHPRALIRQAAVEDRPGTPPGDAAAPAEDPEGARAARGRAATRKPQAFSQDKWQVYGSETFQRIYQKTKTSRQGGKKAKAARTGGRAGPPLPRQEEAAGRLDPTPPQGAGNPVCGGVSAGAAPSPQGGLPASDGRVENRLPERRDVAAGAGSRGRSSVDRAASPTALGCREGPGLGGKDARPPPLGQLEQGCPPLPAPGPLDPESPGPVLTGAEVGGDTHGAGPVEPGQRAPGGLRRPGRGPAEPQPAEDKLPSERKKLKVAEQSGQEWPEPLGGGAAPAGPPQPAPLPSESRDSGPAEKPGGPRGSPHSLAEAAASVALQSVGPGDTEPPRCAAAVTPEPCAPPAPRAQAPGVLASRPDTTFAPKYLLRLPQGEVPPDPPSPRAKDPRCSRGRPGECPFSTGPPLPPGPVPGPDPGGADCLDQRTGVQEEDRGDLADTSTLTAGEPLGSAAEAHGGPVSFRTTPSDTQHLCVGSTLPRAGPSGEARDPWVPSKELGAPPENALDDPPSGAHPRGCLRPSWPEPASSAHSGTPWSCGAQGPFPTLRAEPRLTWCCLSRSLPLPAEQKGRAASVYLALHCPGSSPPGEGRDTRPVSKAAPAPRGQSSTSQDGGGPAWLPKLARPGAPGALSRHQLPEPERKTGPPRGRVRRASGSGRLSALGTSSSRSKGHLSQSRAQRRACRLRPPLWVLRRDRRPGPPLGLRPRGSVRRERQAGPRTAGPHPHGEAACAAASEPPLRRGEGERDDDRGASPGSRAPAPGASTVGAMDAAAAQAGLRPDKAPPAADRHPQDTAEAPGPPPPSAPCWAGTQSSLPPGGRNLGIGSLAPHLPPPRGHVLPGPLTSVPSEAQGPPCASSWSPPCSHAAGSTSVPRGKAAAEGPSPPPLPARPAPGPGAPGSAPHEPAGKLPHQTPAPGPGPAGSQREEGRHRPPFAAGGRRGGGPAAVRGPPPAPGSGGRQGPGLTAPGGGVAPSDPGQPAGFPAVLSRTVKKRSLEGMRRQTRVEFRDSSSEDEDRLVIEI